MTDLQVNFYSLIISYLRTFDYLFVTLLSMIIYSLLGVFFFKANLESRCRFNQFPLNSTYWPMNDSIQNLCGEHKCPEKFLLIYLLKKILFIVIIVKTQAFIMYRKTARNMM